LFVRGSGFMPELFCVLVQTSIMLPLDRRPAAQKHFTLRPTEECFCELRFRACHTARQLRFLFTRQSQLARLKPFEAQKEVSKRNASSQ
jgi:hypothetical protein